MGRLFLCFSLLVLLLLGGCATSKSPAPEIAKTPSTATIFTGEVVQILPIDTNLGFPCNTYPCLAKMKVNRVIQTGKFNPGIIASGEVITVHFPFTTQKTNTILPELQTSFPGFSTKNNLEVTLQENLNPTDNVFKVYQYTLL